MVDLVVNGGFELGQQGVPFATLPAGSAGLPGWRVKGSSIDVITTTWVSAEGARSIDLNGTPGQGSIQQTLRTEIGQDYTLSFAFAGNPLLGEVHRMTVKIDGEKFRFKFDSSQQSESDMGWETVTVDFTATSKRTKLSFTGDPDDDNFGPAIDAVSVVETPAPAAIEALFA